MRKMPTTEYDAIIVGSGITGGWAAKELTEKGLKVLVLEAGRPIVPERDYVEHVPAWELKFRGWDSRAERERWNVSTTGWLRGILAKFKAVGIFMPQIGTTHLQ